MLAITLPALVAAGSPELSTVDARSFVTVLDPHTPDEPAVSDDVTALAANDGAGTSADVRNEVAGPPTAPFARIDGITLHLPGTMPVVVGYHEASTVDALELTPVGTLVGHRNRTKYEPPPDHPAGPDYLVMSSRGRPFPATSAVDVMMVDDDPIVSPVTGTVSDVRSYYLYGRYLDRRVEITPVEAPDLRVVLIHVGDVRVSTGDHAVVGETVLAGTPLRFPFSSQIDRYTEPDRWPHVHLEVKPATATRPGDAPDEDDEGDADDEDDPGDG